MPDYLPKSYTDFRREYPEVASALDGLGTATDAAGPLDDKTLRLVKLGIAAGALAEGRNVGPSPSVAPQAEMATANATIRTPVFLRVATGHTSRLNYTKDAATHASD